VKQLLAFVATFAAASTAGAAPPTTRAEFAKALATIQPGSRAADARALLGPPDDVRTAHDPGGITAARTVEVWRWGAREHLAFGTLGTIHVKADGTIQYVFGGRGAPPSGFAEADLRRLLELIDAVPSYDKRFDPLALIRAVNALVPLGKDRALAAIDEYLRVSSWLDDDGRAGVFLILRALFDVPAGGMPAMMVGGAAPTPTDPRALPRFPLAIVDDVPLKLVYGYSLGGMAEQPEDDVAAFRKSGTIRKKPLAPTSLAVERIAEYVAGPLAKALPLDDGLRVMIYDQALRFAATVERPPDATFETFFPYGPDLGARWAKARAAILKHAPKWDAKHDRLARGDGTVLPEDRPPAFRRDWWDVPLAGATLARLIFERKDDATVAVELRVEVATGSKVSAGSIRLVDPTKHVVLGIVKFEGLVGAGTMVTGQRIQLARGDGVQAELDATTRGPIVRP
jgi:hypothetical protein